MPNRLINETSPYLQQHAHNPVDWYPWGDEALEKARNEDKPILLSVGYSSCHWCHVMAHESFEREDIARLMNDNFVNVKVDREERPDIDSIYMTAVQALTGRGGWPMTVFLTPEGKPFYGGTYFPPEDRHGMPGFGRVLLAMSTAYRNSRGEVDKVSANLLQHLQQATSVRRSYDEPGEDVLHRAYAALLPQFDSQNGGFGHAPKFPQPMVYEFLLRYHQRTKNEDALSMVEATLRRMAQGGIYDQIGGGFHRYSTDGVWLIPHFEKMLYDNALLSKLYVHAYQLTGEPFYRRIVEETLDYVLREMTDPQGGFYSAQDADSEGVEGKYFVWSAEEIKEALGHERGALVCGYYGVTEHGNFEGRSILHLGQEDEAFAEAHDISPGDLRRVVAEAKLKLLGIRQDRVSPGRDEKILTSWNGLMLRSFAEAAAVLDSDAYLQAARRNARFLLDSLRTNGRLLRTYKDGLAKLSAYLEDYAFLIDGLLALHEAALEPRWLEEAISLGASMVDLFWDEDEQGFYDTGLDHETLIVRPRDFLDNALPSGTSAAVDVLLKLAVITGNYDYRSKALAAMTAVKEPMARVPTGLPHWLCALDFHLSYVREVVIIGQPQAEGTRRLLSTVSAMYLPNKVVVGKSPEDTGTSLDGLPLFQGRSGIGRDAIAYVCQNYVCNTPTTSPEELAVQLV